MLLTRPVPHPTDARRDLHFEDAPADRIRLGDEVYVYGGHWLVQAKNRQPPDTVIRIDLIAPENGIWPRFATLEIHREGTDIIRRVIPMPRPDPIEALPCELGAVIRRTLANPRATSDHLLVLADAMDELTTWPADPRFTASVHAAIAHLRALAPGRAR